MADLPGVKHYRFMLYDCETVGYTLWLAHMVIYHNNNNSMSAVFVQGLIPILLACDALQTVMLA